MDKFVVRRPRSPVERKSSEEKQPKLKQATIKSLAKVVVIEDILHLKSSLELHKNDESPETLLEILEKLKVMNPSTKVLKDTRVGHTVNKLKRCRHQSVKELSRFVVNRWKELVVDENTERESIDVRCDARTELFRAKSRKLIADALGSCLPNAWISDIEKKLFHQCQHRIANEYKRNMRSLIFLLKRDHKIKGNIKQGTASANDVLSKSLITKK